MLQRQLWPRQPPNYVQIPRFVKLYLYVWGAWPKMGDLGAMSNLPPLSNVVGSTSLIDNPTIRLCRDPSYHCITIKGCSDSTNINSKFLTVVCCRISGFCFIFWEQAGNKSITVGVACELQYRVSERGSGADRISEARMYYFVTRVVNGITIDNQQPI